MLPAPCASCGAVNPGDQKFCGACGTALTALPPVSTPVVSPGVTPPAGPLPVPTRDPPGVFEQATSLASRVEAAPLEEERRLITAIFCDLEGFTPLTESLDPEEVREIQTMYFAQMNRELHRFGGTVEKYAGDAVLALFGAPLAHEDDAERAVRCALAMQEAFQAVAEMAQREWGASLAVRIGVNTGEAISGAWDIEGKRDYSATGDVVNTAARLQTAAKPGSVIVGPETMHLARRAILFGPRQDLTLKGKATSFPAYPVLGLREQIAERWETREQAARFIGREREIAILMAGWEQVRAGKGRVVTLVAEAGVGKSRLLSEAVERMSRVAGTVVVRGRCLSHGQGMTLHLVADLLRNLCQVREGDDAGRIRGQLLTTIAALLAPWDAETQDAAIDVVGSVLGLPPSPSVVTHASPQVRRQTLIRSIQLLLSALSGHRPAVIVLEDLHWADVASVDVLEGALPAVAERKAMVLATHRTGWRAPWSEWDQSETISLEPLGQGDAVALARSILGGTALDPELEWQVTERAGGNPFFVEELLRSMQETDALEEHDGHISLKPGSAEKLPSTLTELLLARLDTLERRSRSTAQQASVIGRTFAVPLLARLTEQNDEILREPLEALTRADIAFPRHDVHTEYVFKHATVREVAYNTLLMRRRQTLHAACARSIIDLYPVEDHIDIIAFHFSRTREHAEAAIWLERSADRAAGIFANAEAIEQYREVRKRQDMIDAPPTDRARVDEKLGHLLRVVAQYEDALQALDAAAAAYRTAGDSESERRVTAEIGRVHRAQGTPGDGIERITRLLGAQTDTEPTSGLAALHVVLARLYFNLSQYQEDFEAASRGSELARLADDPRVLAEAEMVRGGALYYLRRIDDALHAMEGAVPLAEASGDLEVLSILLGNISVIYRDAGEFQKSLHYQERAAFLTERTGDLANHAFSLTCMGEITFLLGDWHGGEMYLERARTIVRSLGQSWFSSHPPVQLGRVRAARGDFAGAEALIEEAMSIARDGGNSQPIILGHAFLAEMDLIRDRPQMALERLDQVLGPEDIDKEDSTLTVALYFSAWAHLECGNLAEAESRVQLAVKRLSEENALIELLTAQRVVGMVMAAKGDFDAAAEVLDQTVAAAHQVHAPHAEACSLYERGMIQLRQGKRDEALSRLNEALRIFRELGARPYLERVESVLSSVRAT